MYNYSDYTKKRIRGDTIRTVKGILLSLLLHLLVLLLFVVTFKEVVSPPHSKEQKISLNLSQFVPPPAHKPIVTPPIPKPQPVVEKPLKKPVKKEVTPTPTPVVKKKLLDEKKRLVVEKKESKENNVTKTASVVSEKEIIKRVAKRKTPSKIKKEKTRKSKDPLE